MSLQEHFLAGIFGPRLTRRRDPCSLFQSSGSNRIGKENTTGKMSARIAKGQTVPAYSGGQGEDEIDLIPMAHITYNRGSP